MVLVTAHRISEDLQERGFGEAEVRAEVEVSLNGREAQPLNLAPAAWIAPSKSL